MPIIDLDWLFHLFLQDVGVRDGKKERIRVANLEVAPLWINYEVSFGSLLVKALCVVEIHSRRITYFNVENVALFSIPWELEFVNARTLRRKCIIIYSDHSWLTLQRFRDQGGRMGPLATEVIRVASQILRSDVRVLSAAKAGLFTTLDRVTA